MDKPPDLDEFGKPIQSASDFSKPPDLDETGNPIQTGGLGTSHTEGGYIDAALAAAKAPGLDLPYDKPQPDVTDDRPWYEKAWDVATKPLTTIPSRLGQIASNYITSPKLPYQHSSNSKDYEDYIFNQQLKGAAGGALEGVGNFASELTSPLNLAFLGVGGAERAAAKSGFEAALPALRTGAQALGLPFAIHGGHKLLTDPTTAGKAQGAMELAMGAIPLVPEATATKPFSEYFRDTTPPTAEEQAVASATRSQMYPNEPPTTASNAPPVPPITPIDTASGTSPIGPIAQQRNLDNIASSLGRNAPPDIPPTDILDASGRPIAPLEQNLPLERPQGPWDMNGPAETSVGMPVFEAPNTPYREPRYAAGEFEAKPPDIPPDLPIDMSPSEAGTPSFGIPGMRGNLKRIGKNMLVDPTTGEIMNEPPSPETPTDLSLNKSEDNIESKNIDKSDETINIRPNYSHQFNDTHGLDVNGAELDKMLSDMPSVSTAQGRKLFFHDTGGKFTPEEFQQVTRSATMRTLGNTIGTIIDRLGENVGDSNLKQKLDRIGFIFAENLRGLNAPVEQRKGTVLINPFEMMKGRTPNQAAAGILHTTLHEAAHLDVANEGQDFTSRLADFHEALGADNAIAIQQKLVKTLSGDGQNYNPEIQELLQSYQESRRRGITKNDALTRAGLRSESSTEGPGQINSDVKADTVGTSGAAEPPNKSGEPNKSTESNKINWTGKVVNVVGPTLEQTKEGYSKGYRYVGVNPNGEVQFALQAPQGPGPVLESDVARAPSRAVRNPSNGPSAKDSGKTSWITEALNLPRSMAASMDMSAPLRQGIGLIHRPEFWKSFDSMFKSWGSDEAFNQVQQSIAQDPLFKRNMVSQGISKPPKEMQSFAEMTGLKLTDVHGITGREEQFISHLPEKIPGFGRVFKASERAYVSYLNKLRADTFKSLITQGKIFGADGTVNIPLAKEIANYVNTSTGRGSLGMLEQSAVPLNNMLFAPRLIASRMQMLNPGYYIYASPFVRREALKSLFAIAGAGNIMLQLAKAAGAKTDTDPNSADFGKIQFGTTRLDPWAGFQQYIVAAQRLLRPPMAHVGSPTKTGIAPVDLATGFLASPGMQMKSTVTGREYDLTNPGFGRSNQFDVGLRFARGKTTPAVGFAWSLLAGRKDLGGQPMNFTTTNPMQNSIAKLFIPMVSQDIIDVAKSNPKLLPAVVPASWFGVGVQDYGTSDPRRRR